MQDKLPESLLQLRADSQNLELCLGKTQHWTRMLRGQNEEVRRVPGYLGYRGTSGSWELQPWHFERFVSHKTAEDAESPTEFYYALGTVPAPAAFSGKPIRELAAKEFLQVDFLQALVGFLEAVCQSLGSYDDGRGYQLHDVIWDGLLCQSASRSYPFLLLPPELLSFVARRSPVSARLQHVLPFQLPAAGTGNSQRLCYALAALLFDKICGEVPFRFPPVQSDEDLLHDAVAAMLHSHYIPARLFCPELSKPWDQLLERVLSAPLSAPQRPGQEASNTNGGGKYPQYPRLSDWQTILQQPLWHECSSAQHREAEQDLQREQHKRRQAWQRKRFWRQKRNIVVTCCLLIAIASSIVYTPLKRALSPPAHHGQSPYAVVQLYYQALDQLDPQKQGNLSYRRDTVIKSDSNMLTMLFVNTQTRKGYEGRNVLLKAADWLEQENLSPKPGSPIPAVSLEYVPYGLSRIKLSSDKSATPPDVSLVDGSEVTLSAEYDLWLPGSFARNEGNESLDSSQDKPLPQALQPLHQRVEDHLTLIYRQRKNAWYVHKIRRSVQKVFHPVPSQP